MPKFLQYPIDAVYDSLIEYAQIIDPDKIYTKNQLDTVYNSIKSLESNKTKSIFTNVLNTIIFNKDNTKFKLNFWGKLVKKRIKNRELIYEIIHSSFYDNYSIYREECHLILNRLNKFGSFSKNKDEIIPFFKLLIKKNFRKREDLKESIDNAIKKINYPISCFKSLKVFHERPNNFQIKYYLPNWETFIVNLVIEFPQNKIRIDNIKESKTLSKFFVEKHKIREILNQCYKNEILVFEERSGLSQIDMIAKDPTNLVEKII